MLDFLFSPFLNNSKSISKEKLEKLLREISALSPEEREYIKAIFSKYQTNGISKGEVEQAISRLKMNYSDNLDSSEVEKIKQKLLSFFN